MSPAVRGILVGVWSGRGGGRAGTSADWEEQTEGGVSEGITEREGRGWRPSTWESAWLTHTHPHFVAARRKVLPPLLYAGANWVNGYQTPVVWFMLFLITRPFSFCHVGLCLRIKSTLLSVVESTLLPQLHFGWPLTSLFANIITYCEFLSECKINFTEWCESCYLYSSITGGVYQSVSLNNLTFSYFFKRVWRYISLISSDM